MRIVQRRLKQTEVLVWLTIVGVILGSASVVATDWLTNRTSEAVLAVDDNGSRSRIRVDAESMPPSTTGETAAPGAASPTTVEPTTTTVEAKADEEVAAPLVTEPVKPVADAPSTTAAPKPLPPETDSPTTTPVPTEPPTTQPPTTPAPTEPPTTQPPTTPAPTEPPTTQPPTTQPPSTQPPTTPAPTEPPTTQPPVTDPPDDDRDDDDDRDEDRDDDDDDDRDDDDRDDDDRDDDRDNDEDDDDDDEDDNRDDGFAAARINSFTLINAKSDVDLFGLSDGSTVSLDEVGNRLSIRANVNQDVGSVVWYIDGSVFKVENNNPYSLAGNNGSNYGAVKIKPGTYTFTAQMFSERKGRGEAGHAVSMTVTFN